MTLQKLFFVLITLFLSVQFSSAEMSSDISTADNINDNLKVDYLSQNKVAITDSLINYGKLFLDTPYRYGSTGTSSFDCSGFTSFVFSNFGYNLDRSSADQAEQFDPVQPENVKTGDLVFFSGRRKSHRVGHVGIVVSANDEGDFDFIHASVHNGVTISNSAESYYKNRFIKANRVISQNKMLSVLCCDKFNKDNSDVETPLTLKTPPVKMVSKEIKKIIPAKYHTVKSGENLSTIANKFGLSVAELKKKNNLTNSKIKPSQQLKIKDSETIVTVENIQLAENKSVANIKSKDVTEKSESSNPTSHIVKKGESLFSISKMYNITIDELKKINQLNGNGIHFGDVLKLNTFSKAEFAKVVPQKKDTIRKEVLKPEQLAINTSHKVVSGETLFSISKKYNISIDELKKINQLDGSNIRPGQTLNLKQTDEKYLASTEKTKLITHKVGPGESFYTIAKNYGCTITDLKSWNNKTDNKLMKGEKLIVYPKTI